MVLSEILQKIRKNDRVCIVISCVDFALILRSHSRKKLSNISQFLNVYVHYQKNWKMVLRPL